jgi:hypothetical protein
MMRRERGGEIIGAFGRAAAINMITEPQKGGRLHWHAQVYAYDVDPHLLTQLMAAPPELRDVVAKYLESLSCTERDVAVVKWAGTLQTPRPRAVDIRVSTQSWETQEDGSDSYPIVAQKKLSLTNIHVHGFACESGPRGVYMCRLSFDRGLHLP